MVRQKFNLLFHHFWKKESGLTSMLICLCLANFLIVPLFGSNQTVHWVLNLFWMLMLLSGIISLAKNWRQFQLFSILPLCYIILRWIRIFNDNPQFMHTDFIFGIITILSLITMVLIKVFGPGPITIHRIIGSIVVYLLIGNLWAFIFHYMYLVIPGYFNVSHISSDYNTVHSVFLYFSFTTLTTTGFGEILPVHIFARNMVTIEQIIGVLYPVILIGRLVSLKVEKHD